MNFAAEVKIHQQNLYPNTSLYVCVRLKWFENMDLKAETTKPKFDAFQGNPLAKPTSQRKMGSSSNRSLSMGVVRKGSTLSIIPEPQYNFDLMWKGSVSNLMSSENITEDLIKESINELELAMQESKRMLVERDNEILRLRAYIENNKLAAETASCESSKGNGNSLLQQLEESERRNSLLERQLREIKLSHSQEIAQLKNEQKAPPIWHIEDIGNHPECTCYCGSVCKALRDLVETKQSLETTKSKYDNLKKRVKEFRRQAGLDQRNKNTFDNGGVGGENSFGRNDERSSCSIQ